MTDFLIGIMVGVGLTLNVVALVMDRARDRKLERQLRGDRGGPPWRVPELTQDDTR